MVAIQKIQNIWSGTVISRLPATALGEVTFIIQRPKKKISGFDSFYCVDERKGLMTFADAQLERVGPHQLHKDCQHITRTPVTMNVLQDEREIRRQLSSLNNLCIPTKMTEEHPERADALRTHQSFFLCTKPVDLPRTGFYDSKYPISIALKKTIRHLHKTRRSHKMTWQR
jgi:hypothetical protein